MRESVIQWSEVKNSMRSVRLDKRQETRLAEAARVTGQPVSEVIRAAIDEHCDRVLGTSLEQRFADVIGSVTSGGGSSRKTGQAFTEALARRSKRQ